jgi:hypothetical protein
VKLYIEFFLVPLQFSLIPGNAVYIFRVNLATKCSACPPSQRYIEV